jgi:hypothetical protein
LKTENRNYYYYFIFIFIFSSVRRNSNLHLHGEGGRGGEGRGGEGRSASTQTHKSICADASVSPQMRACPRGCIGASVRTRACLRGRIGTSAWTQACPRRRERFILGNFITDAIVRLSHGRSSGHCPSVLYLPRDNPAWRALGNFEMN